MRGRRLLLAAALCACGGKPDADKDQPVPVAPSAAELHFEGRFDRTEPAAPRFQWPGSAVRVRFDGTGIKVQLAERSFEKDEYGQVAHNWYDVTIDGNPAPPFQALEGKQTYTLAAALPRGEHQVVVRKRTEAFVGEGALTGFELEPGAKLLPASAPARRIEFIGDSITAGFGVEGKDASCLFSAETENYSRTYAALTAAALDAEQIAVASAGVGVFRNWRGGNDNTIGELYVRTLPTQTSSRWDFSNWTPDAVVINLGTGDFTSGDPGRDVFVAAYRQLLARVRQNYPSALIVVGVGPMLSDLWPQGAQALTRGRGYISEVVGAASDARIKLIEFPNQDAASSFGCKTHPSAATQQQMAEQLTGFLRHELAW